MLMLMTLTVLEFSLREGNNEREHCLGPFFFCSGHPSERWASRVSSSSVFVPVTLHLYDPVFNPFSLSSPHQKSLCAQRGQINWHTWQLCRSDIFQCDISQMYKYLQCRESQEWVTDIRAVVGREFGGWGDGGVGGGMGGWLKGRDIIWS